jgi:hypothetical protein
VRRTIFQRFRMNLNDFLDTGRALPWIGARCLHGAHERRPPWRQAPREKESARKGVANAQGRAWIDAAIEALAAAEIHGMCRREALFRRDGPSSRESAARCSFRRWPGAVSRARSSVPLSVTGKRGRALRAGAKNLGSREATSGSAVRHRRWGRPLSPPPPDGHVSPAGTARRRQGALLWRRGCNRAERGALPRGRPRETR